MKLTIAEYEAVRAEPTHFFIAPSQEHLSPDIEYVVREGTALLGHRKKGLVPR